MFNVAKLLIQSIKSNFFLIVTKPASRNHNEQIFFNFLLQYSYVLYLYLYSYHMNILHYYHIASIRFNDKSQEVIASPKNMVPENNTTLCHFTSRPQYICFLSLRRRFSLQITNDSLCVNNVPSEVGFHYDLPVIFRVSTRLNELDGPQIRSPPTACIV